jgi:hypothetical protein
MGEPRPLTRRELDGLSCMTPGCDHTTHDGLVLFGRCHPRAPTVVQYRNGVVRVMCWECRALIAAIAVEGGLARIDEPEDAA